MSECEACGGLGTDSFNRVCEVCGGDGETSPAYRPGDIAMVDSKPAVCIQVSGQYQDWHFLGIDPHADGSWTAFPREVGPVLGNVTDIAAARTLVTTEEHGLRIAATGNALKGGIHEQFLTVTGGSGNSEDNSEVHLQLDGCCGDFAQGWFRVDHLRLAIDTAEKEAP